MAFVVLKPGAQPTTDKEKDIIEYCRKKLIKWSCPRNIEFREELPTTLVGKVAFKVLQDQEMEKLRAKGEYTGDN
jgi:long-chain acyl-CoA synthetase